MQQEETKHEKEQKQEDQVMDKKEQKEQKQEEHKKEKEQELSMNEKEHNKEKENQEDEEQMLDHHGQGAAEVSQEDCGGHDVAPSTLLTGSC
jgi:hypothetical protein